MSVTAGSPSLNPRSIRHVEFGTRQRGFAREEVSDFLAEIADAWEHSIEESKDLRRRLAEVSATAQQAAVREQEARAEIEKLHLQLGRVKPGELSAQNMQATVVLTRAQEMAENLVSSAQAEAEQMIADAASVESIDYVRTYAKLTHAQLKSVVTELGRQLDLLGELANQDNRAATWKSLLH